MVCRLGNRAEFIVSLSVILILLRNPQLLTVKLSWWVLGPRFGCLVGAFGTMHGRFSASTSISFRLADQKDLNAMNLKKRDPLRHDHACS